MKLCASDEMQGNRFKHEDFLKVLCTRRSVRALRPEPVDITRVQKVLDAARWAPSPHNAQPWRFAVIATPQVKHRLAEAMGQRWREDLAQDGLKQNIIEARVQRSHQRVAQAPMVIVACLTTEGLDAYPDAQRQAAEKTMAVQSLGAALQNLLLAAHALGLGACWVCAPLFCPQVVGKVLGLPAAWEPQAMVLLGYPAAQPPPPPRRALETLTVYL